MLFRQFDEIETKGKPWEACSGTRCYCQGAWIPGRLSAMLIYQGLRNRGDRVSIPLPFGDRGGLVLSSSVEELECMYGVDGSTAFQRNDPDHPGCPGDFCNAKDPGLPYGSGICGFDGWPIGGWRPQDLGDFIRMHAEHGSSYKVPGFHSGYNEVIVSAEKHNARLPGAVEAFFVLNEGQAYGDGVGVNVAEAQQDFVRAYGLIEDEVPLLILDPSDWEEPFKLLRI